MINCPNCGKELSCDCGGFGPDEKCKPGGYTKRVKEGKGIVVER